jgi:hypothetical protein
MNGDDVMVFRCREDSFDVNAHAGQSIDISSSNRTQVEFLEALKYSVARLFSLGVTKANLGKFID